jgi:hypothetical protein
MCLCSTLKELVALQMAEAKQDMSLNTERGMSASAVTRRVNPRKKSEMSVSGRGWSDARYAVKGSRRSVVAWRNARWSDGQGTMSVDSMTAGNGGSEGNVSSIRSTGRRLQTKSVLLGVRGVIGCSGSIRSLDDCASAVGDSGDDHGRLQGIVAGCILISVEIPSSLLSLRRPQVGDR